MAMIASPDDFGVYEQKLILKLVTDGETHGELCVAHFDEADAVESYRGGAVAVIAAG